MFNKTVIFALAAICLLVSANVVAAKDCSLHQVASLDMTFLPNGSMSVPVELNGASYSMAVGIDSNRSYVTRAAVAKLGVQPIDASTPIIMESDRVTQAVDIADLRMGSANGAHINFFVVPGDYPAYQGRDGMLGHDLLTNTDVEFNFEDSKLNLFSKDHCEGAVVYWSDTAVVIPFDHRPARPVMIDMMLDGKPIRAELATSAPQGMMMMSVAQRLFGLGPDSPGMVVKERDAQGKPSLYAYQFKSLIMGGITVSNFTESIYPDLGSIVCDGRPHNVKGRVIQCTGIYDAEIGLDVLRKLRLYFAFDEGKLYATAADAHK